MNSRDKVLGKSGAELRRILNFSNFVWVGFRIRIGVWVRVGIRVGVGVRVRV
jgi:hypothetical protein